MNPAAILIHGCHLQAEQWDHIVFGNETQWGRVPKGIALAIAKNADLIFWGSGSSMTPEGHKESHYIFAQTIGPKLKSIADRVRRDPKELAAYLGRISHLDSDTQNTTAEIHAAAHLCRSRGIRELYLVSSPTHIARCLQEACKYNAEHPAEQMQFFATPSDTCFANSTPADVVIFEPPHRGDLPKVPFHTTLRRILPLMRDPQTSKGLNKALKKAITKAEEHSKSKTP
jgi:hypothetical protein